MLMYINANANVNIIQNYTFLADIFYICENNVTKCHISLNLT
jgi:hypothetical protein